MIRNRILKSPQQSDSLPQGLILAPFAERELERLAGRLRVEYESWMDSRRMHDPEELAARLNGLGASVLVIELDFVFDEVFEAVPGLRYVGICSSISASSKFIHQRHSPRDVARILLCSAIPILGVFRLNGQSKRDSSSKVWCRLEPNTNRLRSGRL